MQLRLLLPLPLLPRSLSWLMLSTMWLLRSSEWYLREGRFMQRLIRR